MLTADERPHGGASRQPGAGRLLVSVASLAARVERFAGTRARSDRERAWAARLADALDAAYETARADPAVRRGADAVEQRRAIRRKGAR